MKRFAFCVLWALTGAAGSGCDDQMTWEDAEVAWQLWTGTYDDDVGASEICFQQNDVEYHVPVGAECPPRGIVTDVGEDPVRIEALAGWRVGFVDDIMGDETIAGICFYMDEIIQVADGPWDQAAVLRHEMFHGTLWETEGWLDHEHSDPRWGEL